MSGRQSSVPVPPKLGLRPRDRRGFPIPFIVLIDDDGKPHFTINDSYKVEQVIRQRLCALCGRKLEFDCWLIGGPGAAFHENGAFLDPPIHHACGTYALKTCPFLAAPSYSHRIDAKTLDMAKVQDAVLVMEENMQPEQPPFFAFCKTTGVERYSPQPGMSYIIPKRPWKAVEFWNDGSQITSEEAERLFAADAVSKRRFSRDELVWWS